MQRTLERILQFREQRDWTQFHKPKDLAISIVLEAAELLECFQWKTDAEVEAILNSPKKSTIEDEVADIAIYMLLLCHDIDINLEQAVENKLKKNEDKYPIAKARGNARKYTEL